MHQARSQVHTAALDELDEYAQFCIVVSKLKENHSVVQLQGAGLILNGYTQATVYLPLYSEIICVLL